MCLIVLGAVFTVIFLLIVLFIRERPGPEDIEPGSAQAGSAGHAAAPAAEPGKPLGIIEILRMPIFWVLSLSVAMTLSVLQTT